VDAAQQQRDGALARGWRSFRRWRRARPFWAGLFTLLGGLQIYLSTQLSLGNIQLKIGLEGFQSYVIPLVLVLCGLLIWFTPQQRIFYGILAAVVSVYSFIGVNFGGFFIGMLLGIVGGALAVAWTPVKPAPAPPPAEEPPPPPEEGSVDDLLTGPLTDVLPRPVNPLNEPPPQGQDRYDDEDATQQLPVESDDPRYNGPSGPLPRRTPRLFVITLVPMLLAAVFLGNVDGLSPARAAPPGYPSPCPTTPSPSARAASASASAEAVKPEPGTSESPSKKASPSPSPSPSQSTGDDGGNPVGDVIGGIGDAIGDLLGIGGDPTPTPSPPVSAAAPAAEPTPTPSKSAPRNGEAPDPDDRPTPTPSTSCVPVNAKQLPPAAGQPVVQKVPDRMTGTKLTLDGFSFDGVTDLPTATGTIRTLKFTMDKAVTDDFELRVPGPEGRTLSLKSSALTVQKAGNDGQKVQFYCSRFQGKLTLAGIEIPIPLTFTPDFPPPLTLPNMVFTDIDIQLVFVDTDELLAPNLDTSLVS
jgi:hypothetical protein